MHGVSRVIVLIMYTREDAELATIAKELRTAFASHKERLSNRPYKPNKRFESAECWLKVAKVVQHLRAVPEEYIRAQFMYSLGTVFANTLHGPVAQERYKKYIRTTGASKLVESRGTELNSGDVAIFSSYIQQVEDILKEQFGPAFKLTEESIKTPAVKSEILGCWWRFSPVVIMAFAKDDADYRQKFLLSASKEIVESPYLIKAAASLGLDIGSIEVNEELTDS